MRFFDPSYVLYEFERFSIDYLLAVVMFFVIGYLIIRYHKEIKNYKYTRYIIVFLSIFLMFDDMYLRYSRYTLTGSWETSLPLHLCGINAYFISIIAITKNNKLFKVFFFFTLLGTILTLIFTSNIYGMYSYFYWEYFYTHEAYVWMSIYLIVVEKLSIEKKDILRATFVLMIISWVIIIFNQIFNSDYWYLNGRLPYERLNDIFPWPFYYVLYIILVPPVFWLFYKFYLYLESITSNH